MRPLRFIAWGLVLALFAFSFATYGGLPPEIPVHMRLDGTVDRLAHRSALRWFTPAVGALLLLLLFEVMARMLPSRPGMVNIPDKERLLRLPRRFQAPVLAEVVNLLVASAVLVVAVFGAIQWEFQRVATASGRGNPALILLMPMGLTIGLLLLVTRVTSALDRADRAWREAGSPAE
jgi:uncharacterized membrane protein